MYETKVIGYGPSSDKPGSWLKLRVLHDNGKESDAYIKDPSLFPLVNQPGVYELAKTQNGKYKDITGVKFLRPLDQAPSQTNGTPQAAAPRPVDANVVKQNDSICGQVAVKAAAEIITEVLRQGGLTQLVNPDDTRRSINIEAVIDNSALLSRTLMREIGDFVNGKKPVNEKTYVDDVGRTHEKVEGA